MSEIQQTENIDNITPSDNPNNNNEINQNTNVSKEEVSDVSPSSGVSSASSKSTLSKQSGIRPPSRIGRPCGGIHKPAIPATPTKNSSDDSIRRLIDEYGRHRLTDLVEADESEEDGLDYLNSSARRNRYTSIGSTASSMDGLWELHPRRLSEAGLSRHSDSSAVLTEDTDSFMIGQRVWVGGTKPGTIAYIGETQFAPGDWAGIALDEPIGKNDGSVGGTRYFQCESKKGVFSRLTRLTRVPLEQPGMGSNETFVTTNNGVRRSPISPTGSTKGCLQSAASLSISNTSLTSTATHVDFKIGDRVIIKSTQGSKIGTVRYMGLTDFAPGEWVGVELDDPRGKNDGSVEGKRYFECRPHFGLFAPASKVSKSPSKHKPSACVVHSGAGLPPSGLRRANSKESMTSVASKTSVASSVRRVRLGVTSLTPKKVSPKTSTPLPTRTALQDVLREKQLHIEQLLKERDLERAEITRAASQADDAEHKLLTLTQEFEKYRAQCEIKVRQDHELLSKLNIDREKLLNQLEDEKRRNEDLQFRFEEASITKSDIEANVHAQNAASENYVKTISQLETNLTEERHKSESLEHTSNKLFEAEESLIKAREEIDVLKQELEEARKARATAEEKHTTSALLAESLQKQFEGASAANEEKSKTINQLNEEISKVKSLHEVAKREAEESCKEKDSVIEQLKLELENQRNVIEQYEKKDSELVKENSKLKMELSSKILDAETGSEQVSAKDSEIRTIRDTLEQVQKELSNKADDLELHKTNAQNVERDLRTELEETRENLKHKISEVENSKKDYHVQLSQRDQQLEDLNKTIAQGSEDIKKLTEELDQVKTNFEDSKKDIHARHARQVASQDSQLMALAADLQLKNEEVTKASIVISKLEEDLCTKNGVIEKLRLEVKSYEQRFSSHDETSATLIQQMNALTLTNGDLERQLAITNSQIEELTQIRQRMELEIQQLSVKCEGAAQLEQLRNEIVAKEQMIVTVRQDYEAKIQNLERSRQELELNHVAKITEIERIRQELEAKLQVYAQSEILLQQRCETTAAELTRTREEYRIQIKEVQQALQEKELTLNNQHQQTSEVARNYEEQLKSVTDELSRHLQGCQQRISGLTDENLQIKQQLAERSEQLIEAKAEASHTIAQFQQTEKELNQKCGDTVRQIEFELNEKALQLQQTITELQLVKNDCQNTNTDLSAKDHQISTLTAQVQQSQVLITQLQEELNSVRLMHEQTTKEHASVDSQCRGLLEQVASLTEQVRNSEQVFKSLQVEHSNAILLMNQLRITEQQKQQCLQQLQNEAALIAENMNCKSVIDLLNKVKIDNSTENTEKIFTLQRDIEILRNQLVERTHHTDLQQNELLRLQQELLKAQESSSRSASGAQDSNSVRFDTTTQYNTHTVVPLNPLELQIQLVTLKNSFIKLLNTFNAIGKDNLLLLSELRNALNNRGHMFSVQNHLEKIIQNYQSVKNTMHVDNFNLQKVVQYSILQLQEKHHLLNSQRAVIQRLQQLLGNLPLQCKPFAVFRQPNFVANDCSDLTVDNKKITNLLQIKNLQIVDLRKQISDLLNYCIRHDQSTICMQQPCRFPNSNSQNTCRNQMVPGPTRVVRVMVPVIQPKVVVQKVLVPVASGQECPTPTIQRIEVPRIIIKKVPLPVLSTAQCRLPDLTALYDCNVEETMNRLDLSTYNNLEALRFKQTLLSLIGRQRNCIASSSVYCSGLPRFNIPNQCTTPFNIVESMRLSGNNHNSADVQAYKHSILQLLNYLQRCSSTAQMTDLQQTIQEQRLIINNFKQQWTTNQHLPLLTMPEMCLSPEEYVDRLPLVGDHPSQVSSFKYSLLKLLAQFQNCQLQKGCADQISLPNLPSIEDCLAPPDIIERLRLEPFHESQSEPFRRTLLQLLLLQRQCAAAGGVRIVGRPLYVRIPNVVPVPQPPRIIFRHLPVPQAPRVVMKPVLIPVPQPAKIIQVPVPQGTDCKMTVQKIPIKVPVLIRIPVPVPMEQSCRLPHLNVFDWDSSETALANLDLSSFNAADAVAFKRNVLNLIQRTCNSGGPALGVKIPVPFPILGGNQNTYRSCGCNLPNLSNLAGCIVPDMIESLPMPGTCSQADIISFKQTLWNMAQSQKQCGAGGNYHPQESIRYIIRKVPVPRIVTKEVVRVVPKVVMKPVVVPVPQPPKIIQVPVPQGTDCKMTVQQVPIKVPVVIRVPVPMEQSCRLPDLSNFDCDSPTTGLINLDLSSCNTAEANTVKQNLLNFIQRVCSSRGATQVVRIPVPFLVQGRNQKNYQSSGCSLPNLSNLVGCIVPDMINSLPMPGTCSQADIISFKQTLWSMAQSQKQCGAGGNYHPQESIRYIIRKVPVPRIVAKEVVRVVPKVVMKPVVVPVPQPPNIIQVPVPQGTDCKMTVQQIPIKVPVVVRVPVSVPMEQSCRLPDLNIFNSVSSEMALRNLDLSSFNVAEAHAFKQGLLNLINIQRACDSRGVTKVVKIPIPTPGRIEKVYRSCGCSLPNLSNLLDGCIVPGMIESLPMPDVCSQAHRTSFKQMLWTIAENQKQCTAGNQEVTRTGRIPVYQRIPIPVPVEKIVVKEIKVPVYQRVPMPVVVPKEVIRRMTVKVPVPVPHIIRIPVVKTQQIRVLVPVPQIVHVPRELVKEVLREVKVPVKVIVPGPPQISIKEIPVPQPPRVIFRRIPIVIEKGDQQPRIVRVPVPITSPPRTIIKRVPVQIPVPVKVPVYVTGKCHLPLLNLNTCEDLESIQNQIGALMITGYDEADAEHFKQRLFETYVLQRNCHTQGQCRPSIVQVPGTIPKEIFRIVKVPVYQKVPVPVPVHVPKIVRYPVRQIVEVPKLVIREVEVKVPYKVPVPVPYSGQCHLPNINLSDCQNLQAEIEGLQIQGVDPWEARKFKRDLFKSFLRLQDCFAQSGAPIHIVMPSLSQCRPIMQQVPVRVPVLVPVQIPGSKEFPNVDVRVVRVPTRVPVPVQVPSPPQIIIKQVPVPVRQAPRVIIRPVPVPGGHNPNYTNFIPYRMVHVASPPQIIIRQVPVRVNVPVKVPVPVEVPVPVKVPVVIYKQVPVDYGTKIPCQRSIYVKVPVPVPRVVNKIVQIPVRVPVQVLVPQQPRVIVQKIPVYIPSEPQIIFKPGPAVSDSPSPHILVKHVAVKIPVPVKVPYPVNVPVRIPVQVLKKVPIPVPMEVPKVLIREVRVPVRVLVPVPVKVPQIQIREVRVPIRIPVEVPKIQIRVVRVPVNIPYPVRIPLPPRILIKQTPVPVSQGPEILIKQVPIIIAKCNKKPRVIVKERPVPIFVSRPVIREIPVHIKVPVQVPVKVPVPVQVPVEVSKLRIREIRVPIKIPVPMPVVIPREFRVPVRIPVPVRVPVEVPKIVRVPVPVQVPSNAHLPDLSAIGDSIHLQAQIEDLLVQGFNYREVQKFKQGLLNMLLQLQTAQSWNHCQSVPPVKVPVLVRVPIQVYKECHLPDVNLGDCTNVQARIEDLQLQGVNLWEAQKFKQDLFASVLRLKDCFTQSGSSIPNSLPSLAQCRPISVPVPVQVPVPIGSGCHFPEIHVGDHANLQIEVARLEFPGCNELEVRRFKQNLLDVLRRPKACGAQIRLMRVPVDRIVRVPVEVPKIDVRVVKVPFKVPIAVHVPSPPQIIIKQVPVPVPQAPRVIIKPAPVPGGHNAIIRERVVRVPSTPQLMIRQVPVSVTVPVKVPVPVQVPVEVPVPIKVPVFVRDSPPVSGMQCQLPDLNVNGCGDLQNAINSLSFPGYNPYQILEFKQNLIRLLLEQRFCMPGRSNNGPAKTVYIRQPPLIVYQQVPVNMCDNEHDAHNIGVLTKQVPVYIKVPVPVQVPRIVVKIVPKRIIQQIPVPQPPQIIEKPVPIPMPSLPKIIMREIKVPVLNGVTCPVPRVEILKVPVVQPPRIITKPIVVRQVVPLIKQMIVPYPVLVPSRIEYHQRLKYYASQVHYYKRLSLRLRHILRRYLHTRFNSSLWSPVGRPAVPLPMLHVMKPYTTNIPLIPVQPPSSSIGFNSEAFVIHVHQAYKKTQEALSHCMDAVLTKTLLFSQLKSQCSRPQQLIQDRELADNQIRFLNSIIVDIQKKNEEQRARIEILEAGGSTAFADDLRLLGSGNRQVPPRMYCDICEEFDLHETEDCPQQTSEEVPANGQRERRDVADRPYCEICEAFGHATEDCKEDQTF